MASGAVRAQVMSRDWAELGGVQLAEWMDLGEAGVGAACAAVFPLAALYDAGNLQARHD